MMTDYLSNVGNMKNAHPLGAVVYLKIERLSHDGLMEGFVSEEARMIDGSALAEQPKVVRFSLRDFELGLPGFASEYLVKRLHMEPKNALTRLFDPLVVSGHRSDRVHSIEGDVWFKLTRYDVSKGYELVPMFTHKQFQLYMPYDKAWFTRNGDVLTREPVRPNAYVVNRTPRDGEQRESDRVVALYDLSDRMMIDFDDAKR